MAIKQITSIPSASPEGKCVAKIREVRGKSLVWNQLIVNGNFARGTYGWNTVGGSVSSEGGILTYTKNNETTNLPAARVDKRNVAFPAGHKYYYAFAIRPSVETVCQFGTNGNMNIKLSRLEANVWKKVSGIFTHSSEVTNLYYYCNRESNLSPGDTVEYKEIILIDLTLMFGAGNEPTTVEEFEAMFPLPYYEHNPGEIISNKTASIGVTGRNVWDEEWENGGFLTSTGERISNDSAIRNKNLISVFPNSVYYFKGPSYHWVHFYDSNENWLGVVQTSVFTTPSNCRYINFQAGYSGNPYTTYNHDICINLSDTSRNGTYEPYKKSTLSLNISTLTGKLNGEGESVVIFPDGMRSAGSAYDYLIVDEDGYARKAVKVMDSVDLGTLGNAWGIIDAGTTHERFQALVTPRMNSISATVLGKILCPKYTTDTAGNIYAHVQDKTIGSLNGYVQVYDSLYSSQDTFIAAMSGVELVYELATPLEYVLDTPILMEYNTDGGTEQIVFSENLLSTPLVADVDYFNTAIKHIQFSDETHCIRDERITGVDSVPIEHSTNVVTSAGIYKAISGFSKTDTKVTQTVTASSNTSFRPLLLGYSYSDATTFAPATVTNTAYATHLAKFAPSTGILSTVGLNKMNTNGTVAEGSDTDVFNTNGTTSTIITSEEIDILPNIPDYSNEALFTEIFAYGVEWDTTVSSPNVTRIGNIALHKQLPIQSAMRGCVVNNKQVVYWLNPSDWSKKLDGTNSVLDGTDGDVMVYVPKFYYRSWIDDTKRKVMISTVKINNTWVESPAMFIDAYHPTLDRTNLILRSIMNTSAQFRGGSNNSAYDTYLSTDIFRTDLGKPATYITRANARIYARNGGKELLNYHQYKAVLYWLFVIEYATFNSQKAVNTVLTSDGYRQGGLGNGMTTWSSSNWNGYNTYGPITPNGYTNSLGNFTGQVAITIPDFTYTSSGNDVNVNSFTCYANRYRGIENPFGDIWTNLEGIIVDANHSDYDLVYTTNNSEFYGESINNGFIISGNNIHSDGYIKQFDLGTTAEIIPYANGASISTYKCDYHYAGAVNGLLRTVLLGGYAHYGGTAGLGCFASSSSLGSSTRRIGFRQVMVL